MQTTLAIPSFSQSTSTVPLGVVTASKGDDVIVEYDSKINVSLGAMIAIYGLGSLERHPLTKKIILMGAEQVAKAQIVAIESELLTARLIWKGREVEITAGMDVTLLSGDSASNSAPAIVGQIRDITTLAQQASHLDVPIVDPDGDSVVYKWKIEGPPGQVGFLDARITYLPKIIWFTPGIETNANLVVTATDSHFQTVTLKIPVTTLVSSSWSDRELKPIGKFGLKTESNLKCLARDDTGQWWGASDGLVFTISSGWRQFQHVSLAEDIALFKPITLVPYKKSIHILDKSSRSIFVLRSDGVRLQSYGDLSNPTDLVISKNGTVYVADQVAGGIMVYNIEGKSLTSLGASREDLERFIQLTKLTLGTKGELFALDQGTRIVHRFDSEHQRLTSWPLPLKGKEIPIDIASHPKGYLLILLNNGRIMTVEENGKFGMSMEPASGVYTSANLDHPDSIFIDTSEEIYVTYGEPGLIARYSPKGSLSGLRGSSLWALDKFTVDGAGNIYGLHKGKRTIYCFDHEGWLTKELGSIGLNQRLLENPIEFSVKFDGSELVILEIGKNRVVQLEPESPGDLRSFSLPEKESIDFHKHMTFAMDDLGRTYILDPHSRRVLIFDGDGQFHFKFGRGNQKGFTRSLQKPSLLAVDPNGKFIYIYDKHEIKMFELNHETGAAVHVVTVGSKGTGVGQFKKPISMVCDRRGLLYILDVKRRDLQVIDYKGKEISEVYTRKYSDWGLKRVDDMIVDPDGHVFLVRSNTLFAIGW